MKSKAIFYHAGCPVCVAAEQNVAQALDPNRYDLEIVHLSENKNRVSEAEAAGVKKRSRPLSSTANRSTSITGRISRR